MNKKTIVKSDIEIAMESKMKPIVEIARALNIDENEFEPYGKFKGKISLSVLKKLQSNENGKLILVTAINPTKAGEGKSTVTVGLGDALAKRGKKAIIAMREPSLGPVMGIKGGATGGGYSQILPMDEINLHFTGDIHAITCANNTLSAFIDNHIHQGNALSIDPERIIWKRCMDLNDRALRQVTVGLGGPLNGTPRHDGFDITVASEIMAVLCLSNNLEDLKTRLARMIIAYTFNGEPVSAGDLEVEGALTLLLKEALKPNLVQTIEHTPALIHGGPFANIAHGCNSVLATKTALKLGDYVVTEAGFGADLGAEKFLNIKMRYAGLTPSAVVIVATIRALKQNGGVEYADLKLENVDALKTGFVNLVKHWETISKFGLPAVVAVNRFMTDTDAELEALATLCNQHGINFSLTEVWEKGGLGGVDLADKVLAAIEGSDHNFRHLYDLEDSLKSKIETIAREVYGADGVEYSEVAEEQLASFEKFGWGNLPICMAKTQYSLTDDPKKLGRPTGFKIQIRHLKPSIGAGFIVCLTGNVMTMPGLPKRPAGLDMNVDADGNAVGLF